jgi:antitoxin YefM
VVLKLVRIMQTSYSELRSKLAYFLDEASSSCDPVIIRRRGREDVALIAAAELDGLMETAHLLRSPRNATRLNRALESALAGKGESITPQALADEFGERTAGN